MIINNNCKAEEKKYDIFPQLSKSLFYFIENLYLTVKSQRIDNVFFLSREGQPLMKLFELYLGRVGEADVIPRYLEVSRRSTLLPSLSSLEVENFETLFRQYRRISLLEFLSSLGLEAHLPNIANSIGLPDGAECTREEDFPTCTTFTVLKSLPLFQDLYESERLSRRTAFISYLTELSGGVLPAKLVIVDVGWKGTIQDNLFALLCRDNATPVCEVTGYYIGLVAEGAAGPRNQKYGLLFSSVGSRTPKFRVFIENRALFEVVLAADHGSIISYATSADGRAKAIRGEFEEGDMLSAEVFPVQRHIFIHFERLLAEMLPSGTGRTVTFEEAVRAHARMVFKPTSRERTWFSSVFHVENYGVFERSHFANSEARPGLIERLRFLWLLLLRRNVGALGFWPWSTLYERGGTLSANLYAMVRLIQR
jgi:hypothetical protein